MIKDSALNLQLCGMPSHKHACIPSTGLQQVPPSRRIQLWFSVCNPVCTSQSCLESSGKMHSWRILQLHSVKGWRDYNTIVPCWSLFPNYRSPKRLEALRRHRSLIIYSQPQEHRKECAGMREEAVAVGPRSREISTYKYSSHNSNMKGCKTATRKN